MRTLLVGGNGRRAAAAWLPLLLESSSFLAPRHSPNREPIVTGVFRRRNFVSRHIRVHSLLRKGTQSSPAAPSGPLSDVTDPSQHNFSQGRSHMLAHCRFHPTCELTGAQKRGTETFARLSRYPELRSGFRAARQRNGDGETVQERPNSGLGDTGGNAGVNYWGETVRPKVAGSPAWIRTTNLTRF